MKKKKAQGYLMVTIGFAMLLFNATAYLLGWDTDKPAFTVLGLAFILIGLKIAREEI